MRMADGIGARPSADYHAVMSQSHQEMAAASARHEPVRCAVLTVSDTRNEHTDTGGRRVREILGEFGHESVARAIVRDEPGAIRTTLADWLRRRDLHAIITTGGTGIARRDTTIEVVRSFLTHELEGFGELFRMLSWHEVGSSAMLSRAVGGLATDSDPAWLGVFLFAIPGSVNAVETAMRRLIGPELAHLVWERKR